MEPTALAAGLFARNPTRARLAQSENQESDAGAFGSMLKLRFDRALGQHDTIESAKHESMVPCHAGPAEGHFGQHVRSGRWSTGSEWFRTRTPFES